MHVFAYGSLLSPRSLRSTLPEVDVAACRPARVHGYTRVFDVAFPNDGSQGDKAYFLPDGTRPPAVLMCNLRPTVGRSVNGILIPVDAAALKLLRARELRYDAVDMTDDVEPYSGWQGGVGSVLGFIGKPEFLGEDGVAARGYIDTILSGGVYWNSREEGFLADLSAGTRMPERIADLRRVDARRI